MLKRNDSGAVAPLMIAAVCFLAVIAAGYFVFSKVTATTKANNIAATTTAKPKQTSTSAYSVLSPATVPPKVTECSQTLSYASDGNPSPVTCSNGELNILDWKALSALEPTVMKLGYGATESQVQAAICHDGNVANQDSSAAISAPLEANAYQLASLYYGWQFSLDATSLLAGGC